MSPLWTRRSMAAFFLVGFGLPWLGWTTLAVSGIPHSSGTARLLFYTGDFMAVAGLVATWVAAGRPGLVNLLRRCVGVTSATIPWALFALLLPALWLGLAALAYGATHDGIGRFEPAGVAALVSGGAWLAWTTGPLGEEAGWRGYFLPRLATRYRPVSAALVLGVIWAVWHFPIYYTRFQDGAMWAVHFTIGTVCVSSLMAVLWAHTKGSVFWAIVLHWSVNVMPGVIEAVFPDIRMPDDGTADWFSSGALLAVTVTVGLVVGLRRLQARLDGVVATLAVERIDVDRAAGDRARP